VTGPQHAAPTTLRGIWNHAAEMRAEALATAVGDYARQGLTEEGAQRAASEDAACILASALEFADAVDRCGKGIAYEDAVLIEGSAGPVVISEAEWRANPAYWRTAAAGGHGRVDRIEVGRLLLHYLRTGEVIEE
jgi:hypothetical protein